jgi:uncharacterized protein YggE
MKLRVSLLCAAAAWGQLQTNAIIVSASRTLNSVPDQAAFSVQVYSAYGATLSDVVNAVSSIGITSGNLTGAVFSFRGDLPTRSVLPPNTNLEWDFNLTVPLSNVGSTIAALTALQAKTNNGLSVSFSLQGIGTSAAGQPACVIADLVADATVQAQQLADAANLRLGPVLAVSDQSSTPSFSIAFLSLPSFVGFLTTPPPACAATVKFGIVRL